jgi:hypothetical protein
MRALAALGCLGVVAGQHQSDRGAVAALDSLLDLSDAVDHEALDTPEQQTTSGAPRAARSSWKVLSSVLVAGPNFIFSSLIYDTSKSCVSCFECLYATSCPI